MSIWYVLGLYHKKIGGLRANIWSQGTVKVKKSLIITSVSIMFQLPPQIVLGCSNSKWYLNLVFHPLNTSCKNQEPTRHEHNVTAFYTKLYWFHHGRSLPRTFSPLTFSITEPSQLHSSSAIGFRHYGPLTHPRTGFIFRRIKSLFHHSNWQHIFLISFNGTSKRGVHYK